MINKIIGLILTTMFIVCAASASVTDNANIIDPSYETRITQLTETIEKESAIKLNIITVDYLKDVSEDEFLVISNKDKDYKFGNGFNLTDEMKITIGERIIVPNFRNGEYGKGIYDSMLVVQELLKGNPEVISQYNVVNDVKESNGFPSYYYIIGFIVIIVICGLVKMKLKNKK